MTLFLAVFVLLAVVVLPAAVAWCVVADERRQRREGEG